MSVSTQVRRLHQSAAAEYMRAYKSMGVNYPKTMDSSFKHLNQTNAMYQSPRTVEEVVGTEFAMKKKGFTPFVTAMPAASKVLMRFFQKRQPSRQENFQYLRSPLSKMFQVSQFQVPSPRDGCESSHHLSMGYAFNSATKPLESPASWGFVNHFGPEMFGKMSEEFLSFLKDSGMSPNSASFCFFKKKGLSLIRRYCRLKVGEFVVLGFSPDQVDRYVYDAKPFGLPTGKKASAVAADPAKHLDSLKEIGVHMASMVMCRETLQPNPDMVVVLASESDAFRSGVAMKPMGQVEEFNGLVSPTDTEFETNERQTKKELDAELEALVREFQENQENPKTCFPEVDEVPFDSLQDCVAQLP